MKNTLNTALLLLTFVSIQVWAEHHQTHDHHNHHHEQTQPDIQVKSAQGAACQNTIGVKVNGLVCDFCARALEKVVGKRDDVSGVDVDLDNGSVIIAMEDGKTIDDNKLEKLITDSGYNVVKINRGC